MEMVRVDPKLFIICRLCLEETGTYQVTPNVAGEIEYCFSIHIDQYDGLPQLICEKCQKILNEYTTLKRLYVGRQNALKTQLQVRKEVEESLAPQPPQQEAVSSSQLEDCDPVEKPSKPRKRKSRILSSSSSASSGRTSSRSTPLLTERSRPITRKSTKREPWQEFFIKRYACKICPRQVTQNITNHIKTHAFIIKEHKHILARPCEVRLIKLDQQPNLTGSSDTLVLRPDRILGKQQENAFVIYSPKDNAGITEKSDTDSKIDDEKEMEAQTEALSDDDDSDFVIKRSNHKRPRLLSTDTVVLNEANKSPAFSSDEKERKRKATTNAVIECINLDESSNDSGHENDERAKDISSSSVEPQNIEAIKNIIKACHSKYVARKNKMVECDAQNQTNKSNNNPHLKTKLLSMGRRIIKNDGLSCTGLLRYMEHKNLSVKWIPTGIGTSNKEGNFVRVQFRLRGKNELVPDNIGWKDREVGSPSPQKNKEREPVEQFNEDNQESTRGPKDEPDVKNGISYITVSSTATSNGSDARPTLVASVFSQMLSTEGVVKTEDNQKLLNASPVANPKQLPKKSVMSDSKLFLTASIQNIAPQNGILCTENNEKSACIDLLDAESSEAIAPPEGEMCMPIITSTTSLVSMPSIKDTQNDGTAVAYVDANVCADIDGNAISTTEKAAEKPTPFRLKVKPVSEINSAVNSRAVLTEINQRPSSENVWTFAPEQIQISQPQSEASGAAQEMQIHDSDSQDMNQLQGSRNWVVMDTVELPNTKTDSPFRYITNLLKIHNIVLMEPNESINSEFTCLIKFRLQFQRPMNQSPLTLCLSVHCHENKFYIGVRDPSSAANLDLNKLPANWQWEILKVYTNRPDVITKMTLSAQKSGRNVYENTQNFLCILKSITFKNVTDTLTSHS